MLVEKKREQIFVCVCVSFSFEVMCVHTVEGERQQELARLMMNMDALFSHAYLHREPSAPCQCVTCSSEPSPGQQEFGGLREVMALMGGAGDQRKEDEEDEE